MDKYHYNFFSDDDENIKETLILEELLLETKHTNELLDNFIFNTSNYFDAIEDKLGDILHHLINKNRKH